VKRAIPPNRWNQAVYIPPLRWTPTGLRRIEERPILLVNRVEQGIRWRVFAFDVTVGIVSLLALYGAIQFGRLFIR
jgi:hypothetical protein